MEADQNLSDAGSACLRLGALVAVGPISQNYDQYSRHLSIVIYSYIEHLLKFSWAFNHLAGVNIVILLPHTNITFHIQIYPSNQADQCWKCIQRYWECRVRIWDKGLGGPPWFKISSYAPEKKVDKRLSSPMTARHCRCYHKKRSFSACDLVDLRL